MKNNYNKKNTLEKIENKNKIIDNNSNGLSIFSQSKIVSPEVKLKKSLKFNGNDDNTNIFNNVKKYDANKQNIIINNKYNINDSNSKTNNILTISYEFKNKKINNANSIGKVYAKKYILKSKKEEKDKKINNGNLKINKEKEILFTNFNFAKINNNINKNICKKNLSQNKSKINEISNNLYKKVVYSSINNIYDKDKNNMSNIDNNGTKINSKKVNNDYSDNKTKENENEIKKLKKNSSISADKISINPSSKNSLKFLIHEAHKMKELTESFNKNYIPGLKKYKYKKRTYDPNVERYTLNKNIDNKINNDLLIKDINNNIITQIIDDKNIEIVTTETILEDDKKGNNKKHIKDLLKMYYNTKEENKNKKRAKNKSSDEALKMKKEENIEIGIQLNDNELNYKNNNNNAKSFSESKNIMINNNSKNWSFLNAIPNNYLIKNNNHDNNNIKCNLRKKKYSITFIDQIPSNIKNNISQIELEELYTLAIKYKNIIKIIKDFEKCPSECLDWITYIFNSNLFNKIIKIFKSINNKNSISNYIKTEILCIFLGYNTFIQKNFNQINTYLISLFNLLNKNFLLLLIFLINNCDLNSIPINNIFLNNDNIINKIKQLIINDRNLKSYLNKIQNENNLITLIMDDFKDINYYYKYIVDKIYLSSYNLILKDINFINNINYNENNRNIFPLCFKLDKNKLTYNQEIGLISLFFYDSFKMPNNYIFEDLYHFFEEYLLIPDDINTFNYYKYINKIIDNNDIQLKNKNFSSIDNNNNPNQYYLPPIKKGYKYTLVLDLDETLVYCRKDSNNIRLFNNMNSNSYINAKTLIMRPGLLEFLHKMKQIYELVLFSFGTSDYVNNIVNIIEKKEKFFEHILYRQHATYSDNIYIKNLSLLGRDLKNIIIVDDLPQVFKFHKDNGISIKPFFGDVVGERNTLKMLGNILQKIRFHAEETGDIRISLEAHKNLIMEHITTDKF